MHTFASILEAELAEALWGFGGDMRVVLKVLVKKGPLGIHFLKRGS